MLVVMYLLSFIVGAPLMLAAGMFIAEWHIGRLARNGGESNYPQFVQNTVESYRRQNDIARIDESG